MRTKVLLFIFFVAITFTGPIQAQSIKILGGNTLNGAMTGTILGGATMALQNTNDFDALRVGLGAGTLYGIGVGVYDLSRTSTGEVYYVSGIFNDGDNTSIIVLLDTFYGAAAGAIVATAFNLIANEPVTESLQYGAGIGAWTGFGFGLIDGFILSQRPGDFAPEQPAASSGASGLIQISDKQKKFHLSLLDPGIYSLTVIHHSSITVKPVPALDVVSFNVRL